MNLVNHSLSPAISIVEPITQLLYIGSENYDQHIRQFNQWLSERNLSINEDSVKEFIRTGKSKLSGEPWKPRTLHKTKAALKAGIKKTFPQADSVQWSQFLDQLFLDIRVPYAQTSVLPDDVLTETQIDDLVEKLSRDGRRRAATLIRFLFHAGVRISEALQIRIQDLRPFKNLETGKLEKYVVSIKGKGNKIREIKISPYIIQDIKEAWDSETYLFTSRKTGKNIDRRSAWALIKRSCSPYFPDKNFTNHLFRHCFATDKVEKKIDPRATSRYMGHADHKTFDNFYNHAVIKDSELGI